MAFNYYAKLVRIIESNDNYIAIRKVNKSVKTKKFNGKNNYYDHYYLLLDKNNEPIKYGKFYDLEKFANYLKIEVHELESKTIINFTTLPH